MKVEALTLEQIRIPLVQDVWTAVGQEFFDESGYPGKFNPVHFWNFWAQMHVLDMGKFFVVYGPDRVPAGAFGCTFYPDPLTGETVAAEQFWFVRKQFRGSARIGVSLFKSYEAECDRRKVGSRFMAHIHGHNGEALGRFYERAGYYPFDKFFRKDRI